MDKVLKYWKVITFVLGLIGGYVWYVEKQNDKQDMEISNLKIELNFEKLYNEP